MDMSPVHHKTDIYSDVYVFGPWEETGVPRDTGPPICEVTVLTGLLSSTNNNWKHRATLSRQLSEWCILDLVHSFMLCVRLEFILIKMNLIPLPVIPIDIPNQWGGANTIQIPIHELYEGQSALLLGSC